MTNIELDTVQSEPAPDFNGLSPEVFRAGNEILDVWNQLSVEEQTKLLQFLFERLGYDLLQDESTDEQLKAFMEAARREADSVQRALESRDARRRPQGLRPDDY